MARHWLVIAAGLAVVGYGLNLVIQFTYVTFIGNDNPRGVLHAAAQGGAMAFVPSLLGGALFTPFGEEILFRGVIANALNRFGAWAGVGLSSVIFGLVHGVSVILLVAIMVGLLSPSCSVERARSGRASYCTASTTARTASPRRLASRPCSAPCGASGAIGQREAP